CPFLLRIAPRNRRKGRCDAPPWFFGHLHSLCKWRPGDAMANSSQVHFFLINLLTRNPKKHSRTFSSVVQIDAVDCRVAVLDDVCESLSFLNGTDVSIRYSRR